MESFSFFSAPSSTFTAYDSPLEVIYLCVPYKLCIAYLSTRRWLLVTDGRDRSQPLARYERLWGLSAAIGRGGNVRIMRCHVRSMWDYVMSCEIMWCHVKIMWCHVRSCDVMWDPVMSYEDHVMSWDHVRSMTCNLSWDNHSVNICWRACLMYCVL